jgi:hypothetical protein
VQKQIVARLTALAAACVLTVTVGAVKYGVPDTNNIYPWVGLMVAYDADWQPLWRCTGSLIQTPGGEDLFLTAAHCTEEPADHVAIWFNYDVSRTSEPEYPDPAFADAIGTPEPHPEWSGALTIPQTNDVGVVYGLTYQNGYVPTSYGKLADVGTLDALATRRGRQNVQFTVVGYGLQSVKPVESARRVRMIGTVSLVNLQSALAGGWNLHYSSNPGLGHGGAGGTCFGDSGGPVLYDGQIIGVNSFVLNSNCAGAGFAYRIDTAYALAFINGPHPAGE